MMILLVNWEPLGSERVNNINIKNVPIIVCKIYMQICQIYFDTTIYFIYYDTYFKLNSFYIAYWEE